MKKYDIVIIGGGPAGIVTAMTAQKEYRDKSILIISSEEKALVPCGIPYVFHKLGDIEKNRMHPKPFIAGGGELLIDTVIDVNTEEQFLTVSSKNKISYDKLVFATGSSPIPPSFIKGFNPEYVELIAKSYSAISEIHQKASKANKIVILGSGFTAVEVAEQLALENKEVHLIFRSANCLHRAFSPEFAEIVNQELVNSGVILHSNSSIKEIKQRSVFLDSGEVIEGDMLIAALGFKANVELAVKSGLAINDNSQIIVDNYQRTNIKNVFAVGDCANATGFITGRHDNIMLASTATAEARVLGHNLFKIRIKRNFPGTLSVFATEINKTIFASAGAIEQEAAKANISYITSSFSDVDRHPGTLPDTNQLTVKIVVMPEDGQIIGGEVVGSKSSAELINVIALAIQKYVTVYELISFQIGSHPLLTGAPTKTVLIKAAEDAINKISQTKKI